MADHSEQGPDEALAYTRVYDADGNEIKPEDVEFDEDWWADKDADTGETFDLEEGPLEDGGAPPGPGA